MSLTDDSAPVNAVDPGKVIPFPTPATTYPDPIPGIIDHGSINMLAGASGVGKTCFLSWLLKQVRDGQPVFGRATNAPTQVGYVAADRGWTKGGKYWFDKAGYDDIQVYSLVEDTTFPRNKLRQKQRLVTDVFKMCLDKLNLPEGALVAVDPAALFFGNLNEYHTAAVALIEIRHEIQQRKLTMIGLAHAAKQKADKKERYQRLQDRINGSGAQHGYGDTQMYLASPDETGKKHYTFLWHPHTSPAQEFPLGRDTDGMFIPWALSQQSLNDQLIYACIPEDGSSIPLSTILGLCSTISRPTVFRRLKELVADNLVEKPAEGQYRRVGVATQQPDSSPE